MTPSLSLLSRYFYAFVQAIEDSQNGFWNLTAKCVVPRRL